jgi:hypothetical protein
MAYNIELTLQNINLMKIKNWWLKCIAVTGDTLEHEETLLGFMEGDER